MYFQPQLFQPRPASPSPRRFHPADMQSDIAIQGCAVHVEGAKQICCSVSGKPVKISSLPADSMPPQMSASIPPEDGYYVDVHLADIMSFRFWENGEASPSCSVRAGQVVVWNLKNDPRTTTSGPSNVIRFHVPRSALDAVADGIGAPRIGELAYRPGAGMDDPQAKYLALLMLAEFRRASEPNKVFVDCVAQALVTHVAQTYGGLTSLLKPVKGGLAPWQEKRARELLTANLDDVVDLGEVARECGLSLSHFSRAFRQSVGIPPHCWVVKHRLTKAMEMMREEPLSLSDIALACGFADQSHFTRTFKREVGTSPGAWRRCIER